MDELTFTMSRDDWEIVIDAMKFSRNRAGGIDRQIINDLVFEFRYQTRRQMEEDGNGEDPS